MTAISMKKQNLKPKSDMMVASPFSPRQNNYPTKHHSFVVSNVDKQSELDQLEKMMRAMDSMK